jgi:hypothetical protein
MRIGHLILAALQMPYLAASIYLCVHFGNYWGLLLLLITPTELKTESEKEGKK